MTGLTRRGLLQAAAGAGVVAILPGRVTFADVPSFEMVVTQGRVTIDGIQSDALMFNGTVPGPVLRWREGQEVVIHVTNHLEEPTSIHWHGLLIEGVMDGAPGFNGYEAIAPGATYTYRFKLRQSGTYWYHSHSAMQEQRGLYGAIIIDPAEPVRQIVQHDQLVVLSDHTPEHPMRVLSNLKHDAGWYNRGHRTLSDFIRDMRNHGLAATLADRRAWGEMRMDPTDLVDVTGYQFLVNGRGPADNPTLLVRPGERALLRLINASAMSFFDVRCDGLPMTVVAADGMPVAPLRVHDIRMGVGETYDVIVMPREERAYTLMIEPLDRSGYGRMTLITAPGQQGVVPALRPRAVLSMADMGAAHGDMTHGGMAHAGHGHGGHGGSGHGGGGHAGMDHGKMDHAAHNPGSVPPPTPQLDGPPIGWDQTGTPPGEKALNYADLRALRPSDDTREPTHEITVRLTGQMERYIWGLNGHKMDHAEPIRVRKGERVRITYINETMMAHPMHLHGMFVELENGQKGALPRKHVTIVPPGRKLSVVLTANEVGEWPFHCHLMYHMASGMMTRFVVEA